MTAESIAVELGGRKSGAGWSCRCPAHEDRSPSLSITERDGRILVHCFSGCPQGAVVTALKGLGLWPERKWTPVERRDFARQWGRDERDREAAKLFANAAHILAEQALESLGPCDPERGPLTALLAALRTDSGVLAEYREWRATQPKMAMALVRAGERHLQRLEAILEGYLEVAEHAA